jgi:hypothetical protein
MAERCSANINMEGYMLAIWNIVVGFSRIYNNTNECIECAKEYAQIEGNHQIPEEARRGILSAIEFQRGALFADTVQVLTLGSLISSATGRTAVAVARATKELHFNNLRQSGESCPLMPILKAFVPRDNVIKDGLDVCQMLTHVPDRTVRPPELDMNALEREELQLMRHAQNVSEFKSIPTMWSEHPVFQKHLCGITNGPIRNPVTPGGGMPVYYERALLFAGLDTHPDQVPNRWPEGIEYTLDSLVSCIEVKLEIEKTLRALLKDYQGGDV